MQFKPEMCQAILDGAKTQTRRLVKYGDGKLNLGEQLWFMQGVGSNIGAIFQQGRNKTPTVVTRWRYSPYRIKWQVGRTYAIQRGRGKKAIGRFRITGIREGQLQDIREEDALEEGVAAYGLYHKGRVSARYTFSVLWDSIYAKLNKPKSLWHNNPEVWVLEFEVVNAAE